MNVDQMIPLAVLLGVAAVAVTLSERSRRVAVVGYREVAVAGSRVGPGLEIARFEARLVLRHPLTWLGLAGTAAIMMQNWDEPMLGSRWVVLGFGLYPLLAGLFIVTHLAVSRDRRAGTDDLATTLPVGAVGRNTGHLLAAGVLLVPIVAVWAVVMYARLGWSWSAALEGEGWSAAWMPGAVELLQPLLVVAVVLGLAVAAGRWWTHPVAAFLTPIVVLFSPFMWAVPLIREGGHHGHYETRAYIGEVTQGELAWHLLFLVGLLGLAISGAYLRDDRRRGLFAVAVVALAAVVGGFAFTTAHTPG